MLVKLLDILKKGKTCSLGELAILLKTDIETVKVQIEYLESQGYIKKVTMNNSSCSKSCKGCKDCRQNISFPVMWELIK